MREMTDLHTSTDLYFNWYVKRSFAIIIYQQSARLFNTHCVVYIVGIVLHNHAISLTCYIQYIFKKADYVTSIIAMIQ